MRSLLTGIAVVVLTAGAAYAADTVITANDCTKSGGSVVTKNGVTTCVYPAGLSGKGYGVYIIGAMTDLNAGTKPDAKPARAPIVPAREKK